MRHTAIYITTLSLYLFYCHRQKHFWGRHGTKFWKILKSQNFGHIDIDFDIENCSFKILILILILENAFPKYWFWYWYWKFWEFWYWYWYWYWKNEENIENLSGDKEASATWTILETVICLPEPSGGVGFVRPKVSIISLQLPFEKDVSLLKEQSILGSSSGPGNLDLTQLTTLIGAMFLH